MRNRIWTLGVGVAAAAAAVLAGGCANTSQQSVSVTPAALVAQSAHATIAQKTADMTLSGDVSVAGQHIPLTGSGSVDFGRDALTFAAKETVQGVTVDLKFLEVAGTGYMSFQANGMDFSALTGKKWISLPIPTSAQGMMGSDPLAEFRILEQQGGTVTPLGEKTLNGVRVTGYSVVPSKASMEKTAQDEFSKLGLDPSQTAQLQQTLDALQPPTISIWLDSSHLVRRASVDLNFGSALAASGSVYMDFDHYGAPVTVTAPSPSDTVSFQQFLQDVQKAGSSGG
jgi:hypothetical protein